MPNRCVTPFGAVALALLVFTAPSLAAGKPSSRSSIVPGPGVITDEEAAIAPDPAIGAEHAVILVEETEQDDSALQPLTRYHLRAKILSNEGRDLANVKIPILHPGGHLTEWWGRTMTPDGGRMEIPLDMLKETTAQKTGRWEYRYLSATLAGVEPGCVIDYGYTYRDTYNRLVYILPRSIIRLPLERPWAVREFHYRWTPSGAAAPAATVKRETNLAVTVTREGKDFVVHAKDLAPVVEEPAMPADYEVHSAVTFYYVFIPGKNVDDYWKTVGLWIEDEAKTFNSYIPPLDNAIRDMHLAPDATLKARLMAAYDWMNVNVRNTSLKSAEELEVARDKKSDRLGTAGKILKKQEGDVFQIALTYMGLARQLGADASLVLASDRTVGDWHPNLLSTDQFDDALVAIRAPGDPPEKAVVVAPSSGLPFGQIPWWTSGGKAFETLPTGSLRVDLPYAGPNESRSETKVEVKWQEDGRAIRWSRSSTGQEGYLDRLTLRKLIPEERKKRLDEICGAGSQFDIARAEAPGIDDLLAGFRFECEGESIASPTPSGAGELDVSMAGPWIEALPELSAPVRHHPVVLGYPRVESLQIDILPPAGYVAAAASPPVTIEGPYGDYSLETRADDKGYHLTRTLTVKTPRVEVRSFEGLRSFLSQIQRADRTPLVFRKAGAPAS